VIPGQPIHTYEGDLDDEHALKEWIFALIDESPDRLAIVGIPDPGDDREVDRIDDLLANMWEVAKAERPDLGFKMLSAVLHATSGPPTRGAALVVHEHCWVGGHCTNGCRDTRSV
jgi:hypothetical protein